MVKNIDSEIMTEVKFYDGKEKLFHVGNYKNLSFAEGESWVVKSPEKLAGTYKMHKWDKSWAELDKEPIFHLQRYEARKIE